MFAICKFHVRCIVCKVGPESKEKIHASLCVFNFNRSVPFFKKFLFTFRVHCNDFLKNGHMRKQGYFYPIEGKNIRKQCACF